jgi:hypothetical protein
MNFSKTVAALALAGLSVLPSAASAALYTEYSVFGSVVENFSSFNGLVTSGPTSLAGGITLTAPGTIPATVGANFVDLGVNGLWGAGNRFAMLGDENAPSIGVDSITLSVAAPVYGVGLLLSHYSTGVETVTLEALDAGNAVLESYVVSVAGGGVNAGQFYGIGRTYAPHLGTPDMVALRITGDTFVLDDVRVTTSPVPSPGSVVLLAAGLGALGTLVRRGRSKSA